MRIATVQSSLVYPYINNSCSTKKVRYMYSTCSIIMENTLYTTCICYAHVDAWAYSRLDLLNNLSYVT